MTRHLEKNSGTLLPIVLSCLFFVFMAAGAVTSLPAATPTTPAAAMAVAPSPAAAVDATAPEAVEEESAVPVAMLMEPALPEPPTADALRA